MDSKYRGPWQLLCGHWYAKKDVILGECVV
jgi:hypothetical protein